MGRPSDREFALKRQLKEAQDKIKLLEIENARLKKQLDKAAEPEEKKGKKMKVVAAGCPLCGAEIKVTELPHATLKLCSKACGWRKVQ